MGIRCLTKFVNRYFKGWKTATINGKLIIDGYALFHALYREFSSQQCEMYGGDYVSIKKEMSKFFHTLVKAGIKPIVVLDGTIDGDKADTISDRAKDRVEAIVDLLAGRNSEASTVIDNELRGHTSTESRAQRIINSHPPSKQHASREHTTPYLFTDVTTDSVKEVLGDDCLFVADCDADVDIACLAIHHQCPVVSNDSDFYIFPLLHGYIPYSRFHWRNAKGNVTVVYGEFYSYQLFCEQFGVHDASLLTVIPVIVGNDTIIQLDTEYLNMIMPRDVYTGMLIENAIKYVASFTTFECCLTSLRKQKLFDMIENIQNAYYDYFFLPHFKPRASSVTLARCRDGSPLPSFILKKYRKGNFLPFVIDVLWIHWGYFNVAVEDMLSEPWCCLISIPIRKAIYGILCGSDVCVSESQRSAYELTQEEGKINGISHVTYDGKQIPLPTLQSCGLEIDKEYGKKILFGILDAKEEDFKNVPKDYELLLVITHYWYKHCTINNKNVLLKSFVLLLQLSMQNKIESLLSRRSRTAKLTLSTQPVFPIASFAHAFAQWQSLYRDIKCLNELLQEPLKLLPVSKFLECSYLYSFVEDVMKGDSKLIRKYELNKSIHQVFFAVASAGEKLPMYLYQ